MLINLPLFLIFISARVFLKKNSHHSLLDILSPRMDIGGCGDAKKKKRASNAGKDEVQNHPLFASLSPDELSDPQAIVRAFNEAESKELQVFIFVPLSQLTHNYWTRKS